MATPRGCLDLLSMLALADNRRFDEGVAIGWSEFLHDLPDQVLLPAGRDAVRNSERYITPQVIGKYAQPYLRKIARDVRSARLRGLVPQDWPDGQPIPPAAQEQLRREFEGTNNYPDEIATGGASTDLGVIVKSAS